MASGLVTFCGFALFPFYARRAAACNLARQRRWACDSRWRFLDAYGFSINEHDGTPNHVAWASVKEIFAFKLDLLTHDTIRLGFRVNDDIETTMARGWQGSEERPVARVAQNCYNVLKV
jgi:hypothetical protein